MVLPSASAARSAAFRVNRSGSSLEPGTTYALAAAMSLLAGELDKPSVITTADGVGLIAGGDEEAEDDDALSCTCIGKKAGKQNADVATGSDSYFFFI